MRQIKASEVKPGMEVQFDLEGWDVKGTVGTVNVLPRSVWIYTEKCRVMSLGMDTQVTVLSEPAPPQPKEPTTFGARVDVAGRDRFVRADEGFSDSHPWLTQDSGGTWASWAELCEMGAVTVIDADPSWTVPADGEPTPEVPETPEVPDRIEEWPENDEALRPYPWRDRDGDTWKWIASTSEWKCYNAVGNCVDSGRRPFYGPWTRVTDA